MKKKLYEYLDGIQFSSIDEITSAILDFMAEEMEIFSPSYSDLLDAQSVALEYAKERGIYSIKE